MKRFASSFFAACLSLGIGVPAITASANAATYRPLLKELNPIIYMVSGHLDWDYMEKLRKPFPYTLNWVMMPFSPTRDVPEEALKNFYRKQNKWEELAISVLTFEEVLAISSFPGIASLFLILVWKVV